ncbi:MAG: transglycosylase SLT domain-containing protein [Betaproteobacteria bacterium]|nr:transglycosylase SLT domain-containing protein [Betaproteobacteria bacterium]
MPVILALAACATVTSPPPASPPTAVAKLPEVHFPPAPLQITPNEPFDGSSADLEPLPAAKGDLWDRIVRGYAIPDIDGPLVDKWEHWYAERPDYVARMVERGRRYLYHIVTEVEQRGMPLEIALLPMVESAFNPNAMSATHASGIWQFMPGTAKLYGLKQNWWFDSRRDVVAATTSALDYLQQLHAEFNDWQLALAAYNWGEGNVERAMARNRARGLPTDYASLQRMADETRNYLPKLQALKNIVADPAKFGLVLADVPDAPYFTVVRTNVQMDVKRAAELAELPLDEFLALNPQHNRPVIAGADEYGILLPIDKAEIFAAKLDLIDQPLVSWQAHRMRQGETLAQVAQRFGMSLETLKSVNGIGPHSTVPTGYSLLVPSQRPSEASAASLEHAVFTTVPAGRTFYYVVRRGDNLHAIAARNGVSMEDIRRWNHLSGNWLRAGQKLRITSDARPLRTLRASRGHPRPARVRVAKLKLKAKAVTRHGRTSMARASGTRAVLAKGHRALTARIASTRRAANNAISER